MTSTTSPPPLLLALSSCTRTCTRRQSRPRAGSAEEWRETGSTTCLQPSIPGDSGSGFSPYRQVGHPCFLVKDRQDTTIPVGPRPAIGASYADGIPAFGR